jgi:D-alanyl-D-alanine carboxypeptidase/D-alanyl-D-alanine-endopeptidase (penicillin-binding protein 4)
MSLKRRGLFLAASVISLGLAASLAATCAATDADATGEAGAPDPRLVPIDWIIDSALSKPHLRGAQVAVLFESLDDGIVLYERNPDSAMIPASNVKIVTGAAALDGLGPEYVFETLVATDAGSHAPVIDGNLYVKGTGDPSLVSEELWQLTEEIRVLGVKRVEGDLVLDASHFDDVPAASHDAGDGDRAYHARTGALALNFNAIAVHVSPGDRPGDAAVATLSPATTFVDLRNRASTGRPGSGSTLSVRRTFEGGRNIVTVEGRVPAGSESALFYRNIDDGLGYFGSVFRAFLSTAGIEVAGSVRRGTMPGAVNVLTRHRSKPLALIVRDLNKFSSNFVAEQLVKAVGAHADGPPGTTSSGVGVLTRYLAGAGADSACCRVFDGSGFSRSNRLSPRSIVKVMRRAMSDFATSYEYASSLSVSGTDGTLGNRMGYPGLRRAVRAKTGLLDGVTAISGVLHTSSGEEWLFSIVINGFTCEAWRAHDLEHEILTVAVRS